MKKKNLALLSIAAVIIALIMLMLSAPLYGQGHLGKLTQQAEMATERARERATAQARKRATAYAQAQATAHAQAQATQQAKQAQACQRINSFQFDHKDSSGNWVFSWDTNADESNIKFQYKGGGVSDVWVSPTQRAVVRNGGKTKLSISPINFVSGQSFTFRVKTQTTAGETCWEELSMNSIPS